MEQTSFWTASVTLNQTSSSRRRSGTASIQVLHGPRQQDDVLNPSPTGVLSYTSAIQYQVRKTGYYCVGEWRLLSVVRWHNFSSLAIVPVTVISPTTRQTSTDLVPFHPTYNGVVLFKNTFDGQLPAADYPKVNVSSPGVIYALEHTRFTRSFTSSCSSRMHSLHVAGHGYATSTHWTYCPSKYVNYISRVVDIVKSGRSITYPVWWGSWSSRWQQIGVRLPDALTYLG